MNPILIPFAGYPIFKIENGYNVTKDELNFIKNLDYVSHEDEDALKLSKGIDILQHEQLKKLKKFIQISFKKYSLDILEIEDNLTICNSWSTIQKQKIKHPAHNHPNHIFSCVYYAKAEETALKFSCDKSILQQGYLLNFQIKKYNVFNSSHYTVFLKTGDIIFFPGQLTHESVMNTNDERITVGTSFFIDGKFGKKNSYHYIDINNNKYLKYTK